MSAADVQADEDYWAARYAAGQEAQQHTHTPPTGAGDIAARLPRLDWHTLWADEQPDDFILEPLLPARRLVTIYSPPKLGKSLLMLEIAVAVSRGERVLGATPDRAHRVCYVDFENDPKGDIRTRLDAMGYGPGDLDQLIYLSFPTLPALDSAAGAAELMAALRYYDCDVLIIDTVSRAVQGEENENDTWLAFYRHTGLALKQAGIALVRLDHAGKDVTRGQRGGSAKSGDVDAVWRLSEAAPNTLKLELEATRMPIAEKVLTLTRATEPRLHHIVAAHAAGAAFDAAVADAMTKLDELHLHANTGRDTARDALKTAGHKVSTGALTEAIRKRKAAVLHGRGQVPLEGLSPGPEDSGRTDTP